MMTIKELQNDIRSNENSYFHYRGHTINFYTCFNEFLISINSHAGEVILPVYMGGLNRFFSDINSAIIVGKKIIDTYIEKGYLS